jgi:flagellar motor switch protein FliM
MTDVQEGSSQAGVRRESSNKLVDTAGISVERLPMLRVVFDRMIASFSEQIRQMTTTSALFSVKEIGTGRIADVLKRCDGDVIGAVYFVPEWEARLFVCFDRRFMVTLIEVLFGGTGNEWTVEDRPFSGADQRIARIVLDYAAKALETSFAAVVETTLRFELIESRMEFVVIGRRSNFSVITKIELQSLGHGGEMLVVIPQPALNAIRHTLEREPAEGTLTRDPRWAKQMQSRLGRTEVTLRAVIEERQFTLADIADLRVGKILQLQATPRSRVRLECKDQPLFWCELGQGDGLYTVRISENVDQEREFIDDILPG